VPVADYRASIEIDAPPAIVFEHLTSVDGMLEWMGQHAELDPTPGGGFAVDIGGDRIRGRYLEVERPHRVVVSWGVAGSDDFPPGASTVEFALTATRRGTRVDLTHRGLREVDTSGYADGWSRYLDRLRVAAQNRRC
jgi:uncharacterized protein YndB with AHSA1/START domain